MLLDNQDVAVFTKLNELAQRRGLKPYDFVATMQRNESQNNYTLAFETPAQGNALREDRFEKMLKDLGVAEDTGLLSGSTKTIIDALDHALEISPKPRRL